MNNCTLPDPMAAQRYHDGELSPAAAADFEVHLSGCATCRATIASWTSLGAQVRGIAAVELPSGLVERATRSAREKQLQGSRRVAWGLLAAASVLLASSLSLFSYSRADTYETPAIMAQWEEYVVASPVVDEEFTELESRTLVAIHMDKAPTSENDHD